jgi:hypothetical protein
MWRQKASDVVFPDDVETIRQGLEEDCRQLQGFHYQIVLRELQTPSSHHISRDAGFLAWSSSPFCSGIAGIDRRSLQLRPIVPFADVRVRLKSHLG